MSKDIVNPPISVKLYLSDWNEEDIKRKIFDALCWDHNAGTLSLDQTRKLSMHIAQTIIMRFNECVRLAEKT